jgi:hypothetical protein
VARPECLATSPNWSIFMATLVLSVIGSSFGGPIGAAIGAAIGQQIDSRLFAPKARKGPRLNDLAIQSSTYGSPIPRLFGRTRVAGTVIWATDIVEDRRKVSAGKGRPKQTTYTYSANFAVALSARQINRIGRIWADGKLLRGEGGDFKTPTMFRTYTGTEDQPIDPFIASAEGAGQAPAYRGLVYVVFEDFQLADYGNRIPSLSFEVIADNAPISIGAILHDLDPAIVVDAPTLVEGIAITGDSLRGIAASLIEAVTLYARDDGLSLHLSETIPAGPMLQSNDFGSTTNGGPAAKLERDRKPLNSLPGRRTLAYYDVERDYQTGSQSVLRPDLGSREIRSEFAATLSSNAARALIERKAAEAVAARDEISLSLPWRYLGIAPATKLALPELPGLWLVRNVQLEGMIVRLSLSRLPGTTPQPASLTDPGRGTFEIDIAQGPTVLELIDLPWLASGTATAPAVYAVASGSQPGWRRAGLLQSNDGGITYDDIGATAAPATIGTAVTVLSPNHGRGFDLSNSVEIEFPHVRIDLPMTTRDGLVAGRNLALLGNELIQFERAVPITTTRFQLSGLLRGRRGTEAAIGSHSVGDRFILIENETLLPLSIPTNTTTIKVQALGLGDVLAAERQLSLSRNALMPVRPVKLNATLLASGDTEIRWTRRSRDGWTWMDDVDAPLGEEFERYRVSFVPNAGAPRTQEVANPFIMFTAAARAADIAAGAASIGINVQQLGSFGLSPTATLTLAL